MEYQNNIAIAGIFFGILFVISLVLFSKRTGKKFDRLLIEKNIPLPINLAFTLPDSWGRAIGYSILILFFKSNSQKSSYRYRKFRKHYNNFNFYVVASKIDIILSILICTFLLITMAFILFIVILGILK